MQVQMDLWRPLDRGPRLRERLSGPHRTEVTLGGAAPGRLRCRRHTTQAASANGQPGRRHLRPPLPRREQANDCDHGQDRRPAEYNLARSEQDFAYWCHGWGQAPWAPPLVEMTSGIAGHLLAWEDHTCHLCTSNVAGSCPKVPLWAFACFPVISGTYSRDKPVTGRR
jgi:hypothetical protein